MRTRFRGRPATLAAAFGAAVLASCTSDAPTRAIDRRPTDAIASPVSGMVDICHHAASGAMIIRVAAAALPAHLAQGDYLTTLSVSHFPPRRSTTHTSSESETRSPPRARDA